MPTNVFFNNFTNSGEQNLIEDLIIESIQIYGHDVYYCPRTLVKKDDIYGEDTLSTYDMAKETAMYIKSFDSYEGDGTFLSKFNLEIRDQMTFTVARRAFINEMRDIDRARPQEGDLIYSTMMKRMFIIKYVNNTSVFYQLGALQTWDCVCEVFEYSNERFSTGIDEIDSLEDDYSFAGTGNTALSNTEYANSLSDVFETNIELQDEGDGLLDWTDTDPFSEGGV